MDTSPYLGLGDRGLEAVPTGTTRDFVVFVGAHATRGTSDGTKTRVAARRTLDGARTRTKATADPLTTTRVRSTSARLKMTTFDVPWPESRRR